MDVSTLSTGEKVSGVAGVLLFLIMILFSWFGIEVSGFGGSEGANAFESFSVIDIILLVTAIAAVALPLMSATQANVDLPVALSAIVALLGAISVILILYRIIDPPDFGTNALDVGFGDVPGVDETREIGAFLGLLAAIGVTIGGWLAMQEEGTTFADERERLAGGRGAGGGPPPPTPGTGQQPPAQPPPPPPPAGGGSEPPPPPSPPPRTGA
jgi:hypothetical protein